MSGTIEQIPLISVLMPVYNAAPYLAAAIESILSQTHTRLELIIKDDCSSDGSAAIAQHYARQDARVRLLPPAPTNEGECAARNALLAAAEGDYMAWMDADDVSLPQRLERQVAFLEANPDYAAVGTGIAQTDAQLNVRETQTFPPDWQVQAHIPDLACHTLMVRMAETRETGFYREIFRAGGGDGDWVMRLCDRHRISNLPDMLYLYRRHDQSMTADFAPIRRIGVLSIFGTRERRAGRPDPLDAMIWDPRFDFLTDDLFLHHQTLRPDEKVLGMSLPLSGRPRLVDVLIPYQGDTAGLARTLDSLDRQSFRNFRILILDARADAPLSPDHPLLTGCAAPVALISSGTDTGAADPRRRMLAAATGAFVVLQRCGDVARADRLEVLLTAMMAYEDWVAVGSGVNECDPQTGRVTRSRFFPADPAHGFSLRPRLHPSSVMLRKAVLASGVIFDADVTQPLDGKRFLRKISGQGIVRNIPDLLLETGRR